MQKHDVFSVFSWFNMKHKQLPLLKRTTSSSTITLRDPYSSLHTSSTMPAIHLLEPTNPFIMYHGLSSHASIHSICYLILSAHMSAIT